MIRDWDTMLEISHIRKKFVNQSLGQAATVLDDVSLTIESGEFFTLLGPSGCGKTTLLRIIAGLEQPTSGRILFEGLDVTSFPPQRRPFHTVFQKHALFPHLTIFDNVAFGLRIQKLPTREIHERVETALALVKLEGFDNRLPETLSGGQSQRVALARALVNRPKVLLLDEPLSALDLKLREEMQAELRLLQRQVGITFIYVTHDQQEAFTLADRIGVMKAGRFEQISSPEELYDQPKSLFAAQFVGANISLPVFGEVQGLRGSFEFSSCGQVLRAHHLIGQSEGSRVVAFVRPEKVSISTSQRSTEDNELSGSIMQVSFRGPYTEVLVQIGPEAWIPVLLDHQQARALELHVGQAIQVYFRPEDTVIFREEESD
ncbi:MAG: spermidine/putrescine ABC transporter ATP-binding protein [Bdellovibrio sp.]|nr:MAG: spermidine/putrescine ABC transporter ATP-binding protein [Bdellovibrio sp.]